MPGFSKPLFIFHLFFYDNTCCNFSSSFVNVNEFFFQNQFYILHVLLKINKTLSYNLFCDISYVCFDSFYMAKLLTLNIHKKHAPHFFFVEEFSGLFAYPFIFFKLKIPYQHESCV